MEKRPGQVSEYEMNPMQLGMTGKVRANYLRHFWLTQKVRYDYGYPLVVTGKYGGFRGRDGQLRLYTQINAKRIAEGLEEIGPFLESGHVLGFSTDFKDPIHHFYDWLAWMERKEEYMTEHGIYLEEKSYTPGWTHFQSQPPKSGDRFFRPY